MSDANFYQILGVGPSASADEIKSAYRDLVKRYHPDLFPAAEAKAEATNKLRQINEAYAVLGNPKRRHDYDQRFIQKPTGSAPTAATAEHRGASPRRWPGNLRSKTGLIKILKERLYFSKKRAAYTLAAVMVVLIVIYANRSVPRLIVTYTLVEKVEVSPPNGASSSNDASQGWVTVGQFATVSECAGILKEKVRKDEQEGSRAAFGLANGTMAITVLIRMETAKARENSSPDRSARNEGALQPEQRPTEEGPESPKNGISKRVRNLECRAMQRVVHESWFQKAWRGVTSPS
jgi:curved DNA-binding protein CbpA